MTGDRWESMPRPDELQGELRDAVNSIRVAPLPEESEKRVVDRAIAWAAALSGTERQPPVSPRPWNQLSQFIGAITMRQRIAFGAVSAAALSGLILLLWSSVDGRPLSAMEKMAESIRKAKSYRYNLIVRHYEGFHRGRNELPRFSEHRHVVYQLASGTARMDSIHSPNWKGPGPEGTEISLVGRPGIEIDHREKVFRRLRVRQTSTFLGPSYDVQSLGNFSGKANRELGDKEINGKTARGFEIDMKKINGESGVGEIWLDAQSNLPLFACYELRQLGWSAREIISDIQWNVDLDPKLFDTTPPAGYTDATPKPPSSEKAGRIIDAMQIYAEASGGHYPRRRVGVPTDDELVKMLGLAKRPSHRETEGKAGKYVRADKGFDQVGNLEVYNTGFAYYGNTVGPKDKNKVLLRWKLDDGRYQVIFGDLRSETVTAERLHELEGK